MARQNQKSRDSFVPEKSGSELHKMATPFDQTHEIKEGKIREKSLKATLFPASPFSKDAFLFKDCVGGNRTLEL